MNILIIDDREPMRYTLRKMMLTSNCGIQTIAEAENVQQALALFKNPRFDLVFIDFHSPALIDLEFMQPFQNQICLPQGLIVVFATRSCYQQINLSNPIGLKNIQFVLKPFESEDILELLQTYINFSSPNILRSQLIRAIGFVFERVARLTLYLQKPSSALNPSGSRIRSVMRFQGPFQGILTLDVAEAFLPLLFNHMVGLDFENQPTPQEQWDALGELTNIICGNYLEGLSGPRLIFNLTPPQIDIQPDTNLLNLRKAGVLFWVPEQGWIESSFILNPDEDKQPTLEKEAMLK